MVMKEHKEYNYKGKNIGTDGKYAEQKPNF